MDLLAELARFTFQFFLWMLLGRLALALLSGGRRTFVTGVFEKATFPVVWLVRRLTPATVGDRHIPVLSLPVVFTVLILLSNGAVRG
jgi:hypothetical protein